MNGIAYGLRLATDAAQFAFILPFVYWPSGLILVGVLMGTSYWCSRHPPRSGAWKHRYWLVLTHLLFFVSVIAVGASRPNPYRPGTLHQKDEFGEMLLQVLWYGSWVSCAFWIWRMRGLRWIATLLLLGGQFLVGGALLMASMSVTGRWI